MKVQAILLCLLAPIILVFPGERFSVDIKVVDKDFENGVRLAITVKNLSGKTAEISENRYIGYKGGAGVAMGNYIVQIEKLEKGQYELFRPSADIGWGYRDEKYIMVGNGNSIFDTVLINGYSFSGPRKTKRGFPIGQFRVKIFFNCSFWESSEENSSSWIEFKIE